MITMVPSYTHIHKALQGMLGIESFAQFEACEIGTDSFNFLVDPADELAL